jgi:anti-sigma28 factor (negative regulator of flagellin synthesis)
MMKLDFTEEASASALTLATAAHGTPHQGGKRSVADPTSPQNKRDSDVIDEARLAKLAELKAKYKAGQLTVDESALASKLIESHLKENPPSQK